MPDPDGVVLDHLGDAYRACHKLDKARDAWQRAVAALKKQEETAKAQAIEDKLKQYGAASKSASPATDPGSAKDDALKDE